MRNKWFYNLLFLIMTCMVILIVFPGFEDIKFSIFKRKIEPVLGLDLRGGMQVVLQAPEGYDITSSFHDLGEPKQRPWRK